MKIAILGYNIEGQTSFDYFKAQGHDLTICDQDETIAVPEGVAAVLGPQYLDNLDRFDLLVRTAGLPPQKILAGNPTVAGKITTQINEFLKVSPTRNIIGVTGTKGKGTTSTLIAKMLEATSDDVYLGGNIGVPTLTFLSKLTANSWVVLELSSFQLVDCVVSPHISVCLMVVPEHLNWHATLEDYIAAKTNLFRFQKSGDIAIYFADSTTSQQIASAGAGTKLQYYAPPGAYVHDGAITIDDKVVCQTDELKLLGAHNWQNVCAALTAAWQVTQDIPAHREVLLSFSGLPHRLELVTEVDGVRYFDDSFGTAPETAIVAMEAFTEPEILILGGRGKGVSFDKLAEAVARRRVKKVIVIGETGEEITRSLQAVGYNDVVQGGQTMPEIVGLAQQLAEPGDVVVLSPGCTSFDMFKNYKERGELFSQAVRALA